MRTYIPCMFILLTCSFLCFPAIADQEVEQEDLDRIRKRVEAYGLLRQAWQTYMRADEAHFADFDLLLDEDREMPEEARKLYNKAIQLATSALDLVKELPDAHLIIANSHHNFDEPTKTERHYSLAMQIDPARDDILIARVSIRIELKDWRGAKADVARLKELGSEYAAFAEKEYDQARQAE